MIARPARPPLLSKRWLSRNSILARILVNHERPLAFITALVTAAVAFEPRIRGGGFAADDWAEYADVKFPTVLGFHSSLDALLKSAGSRVGASLYWFASFSLFGGHTRFYPLLAALLAVVMAFSIYVLLRELRFSIAESLAMMLLTIALPILATVRFWFTPSGSQLSLALFFFGLTLALRAFSATGINRSRLHVASWSLYVLSALYAEVALPLMAVCVLVYLTRARLVTSLRRWAFDLIVVVGCYLGTLSFVNSTAGFNKLPRSMWGEHARLLGDQALTIFTRAVTQSAEGTRLPVLVVLAVLAVAGLLLARSRASSPATLRGLHRWGLAFGVSLLAIVVAYATYVPAMLYYEPLGPGRDRRASGSPSAQLRPIRARGSNRLVRGHLRERDTRCQARWAHLGSSRRPRPSCPTRAHSRSLASGPRFDHLYLWRSGNGSCRSSGLLLLLRTDKRRKDRLQPGRYLGLSSCRRRRYRELCSAGHHSRQRLKPAQPSQLLRQVVLLRSHDGKL
jgi:hypothetical protein